MPGKLHLPIISLAKLNDEHQTGYGETQRLFETCRDFGFFYLVDHGITKDLIHDTIDTTKAFFQLPQEVKDRYHQNLQKVTPKTSRGYSPLYGETLAQKQGPDPKELFDFGLERPEGDLPFTGPNFVPEEDVAPGFKRNHFELQEQIMSKVVPGLLRGFEQALDKPHDFFAQHFREPIMIHRTIYYPEGCGGAGKHTDNGFFTVLIQENFPIPSLRVFTHNQWIDAECIDGAFVINLGDMLQKWTKGLFVSTPHEVSHKLETTRVSIPFFLYPQIGTSIIPIGDEDKADVKGTKTIDIMLENFNSIWVDKSGAGRAQELIHD